MKVGFWVSAIIFIINLIFFFAITFIDCGISIQFPEGVPEDTPNIEQMKNTVDAIKKYNEVEGVVGFVSFCATGIIGLIAKRKGISLT
jgi:hypothetical protein